MVAGALALSVVTLAASRRSRRAVRRRGPAAEGEPTVADTTA
jgi:hypothetical protein